MTRESFAAKVLMRSSRSVERAKILSPLSAV